MLNKLSDALRRYEMVSAGEEVICALSGGADSVALLFGLYLLKDGMGFRLSAAHFNHHLRGEESDRDEEFVRQLCRGYEIPLYVGSAQVKPGEKGLEAAARDARYAYFRTLPGKIATAHTADDNAETVLLHLVRGTALKGLGGIAPVSDGLIRPMLHITRAEVEAFLQEYHLPWITDSSNLTDDFLRNRLRHHVIPLLKQENPRLAENMSAMALSLRQDEAALASITESAALLTVAQLRQLPESLRNRSLERFLKENGIREPERRHIALAEELVFSENPSARAHLPGGAVLHRCYEKLEIRREPAGALQLRQVQCPGITDIPEAGLRLCCREATEIINNPHVFTVNTLGTVVVRPRCAGDEMRLPGGTKSLKKLFIDRKLPAGSRMLIPVLADDGGILGVCGIGADQNRQAQNLPAWQFRFETL
ncbi:MAG: tRNA lysidine(34) synthetase TilS [Oscillospiraceae bacterium]|nr:tRNA lysidine(34) synthetase TilS [Oscillospiraceae bacterium]